MADPIAELNAAQTALNTAVSDVTAEVTSLKAQVAALTPPPVTTAKLLFSEEFDTLDLTTASHVGRWRANDAWQQIARGYKDFAGTSWNANPNETAVGLNPFSVNNGVLSIKVDRIPAAKTAAIAASMSAQGQTGAPAWYGGILISNPAVVKFKYGYFEYTAALPVQGRGMFPALWLYATDGSADPLKKGTAEIDLFEQFGVPNVWHTNLHPGTEIGLQSQDTASFHTYGLDWQPTYLKVYRDNVLLYTVTGSAATYFNTTMGIRLNFAMDAPWFAKAVTSDNTTPPMTLDVKSVKVWDVKP